MTKLKYITTVGDLIEQLSKFNKDVPICVPDPNWTALYNPPKADYAEIKVYEGEIWNTPKEESGVILESNRISVEQSWESTDIVVWTNPTEVEEAIKFYADSWGRKYEGLGNTEEKRLENFKKLLESFKELSETTYNIVLGIFIFGYQRKSDFFISQFASALQREGAKDNVPKLVGDFICKNCICEGCGACKDGKHCNGYTCKECKANAYTGYDWYCDE